MNHSNPEGSSWQLISKSSEDLGMISVSAGPTCLVWGVTWDGHGVVRENVNRNNIYGKLK